MSVILPSSPAVLGRAIVRRHGMSAALVLSATVAPVAMGQTAAPVPVPVPMTVQAPVAPAAPKLAATAKPRVEAEEGTVALTFDDLPGLTILDNQPYVNYLNKALLQGLKKHHFPAIGFVNEGKFDDIIRAQQINVLKAWLKAGMNLGNHTFSHESPNTLGAKGYIEDIQKGEPVTKALLAQHHRKMVWFRHPYLETGTPEATKREIDEWLSHHGYRIAPVTIDADDWEFAEPYDDAISHHNAKRVAEIRAEYLEHTDAMLTWYRKASREVFGREIAYVMLMHATRLNADCIDDFAAMLKRHHLKPVTIEEAMKDPAYRTPDNYAGHDGIEWMERFADTLKKDLPWDSYRDPPKDIEADYNRVDPSGR